MYAQWCIYYFGVFSLPSYQHNQLLHKVNAAFTSKFRKKIWVIGGHIYENRNTTLYTVLINHSKHFLRKINSVSIFVRNRKIKNNKKKIIII